MTSSMLCPLKTQFNDNMDEKYNYILLNVVVRCLVIVSTVVTKTCETPEAFGISPLWTNEESQQNIFWHL